MANTYTDTVFSKLYINVLSKNKYDSLLADNAISDSELYMVPEESFQYVDTDTLKDLYQATLVSGTNIKTINGQSLLGSGDITISGGSGSSIDDTTVSTTSTYSSSKIDTTYAKKTEIPSLTGYARTEYVDTRVSELVNSAPETLDTLKELSDALGGDANFATTVATQIGNKQDKLTAGDGITINGNVISSTSDVDLSNYYTKSEINTSLSQKQNTLVSGTNIKTINGTSILGSGDITISGGSGGVTEDRVNELIAAYMTANYESGDTKEY